MDIIIAIILSYSNSVKAGKKGYSGRKYGLLTFLAFFLAYFLAYSVILSTSFSGPLTPSSVIRFFTEHPAKLLLVLVCGFGGYLLMRFYIERLPDRTQGGDPV